ncbi:MAG: phosphoribosylformylglycinamidine synthase subunit PurL [Candidatus Magnetoovum sp. WYHC-5]|nr:phosphoribosylformylglycinamidine synthase subunit PurL [Candidatus Magnetoovum sp. WYHC-5]
MLKFSIFFMKEPQITKDVIREHGITDEEYATISGILGRKPTFTELGIFSVMWSEHCSYKSSRVHLKKFPTKAPWVIQGPGENAGVIDIGDGIACVFKMESHNHPSFIEPYQGAATGVGGILRDIFTMGARPIASLNSLRFGPLSESYHKYLFGGVVAGIAGYGNCMGVPTVGGEIYFHSCYSGNILVNAFNLGIAKTDKIFYGKAQGPGNLVVYVGSKTGRDGIHGVTMASEEFTDDAHQKRPNVQIGDPFTEKLLLEACLEAMDKGLVVGIQDMGGAGLTSSSSEMAGRAGTGVELELSLVPTREEGMIPYEIMLSESQERMLIVTTEDKKDELIAVFDKWDIDGFVIGKVTDDGFLRVKWHGETYAEIPAASISELAPIYERPIKRPQWQDSINKLSLEKIKTKTGKVVDSNYYDVEYYNNVLLQLAASPSIASKRLVYEEYDHMVQINTLVLPGRSDSAVVRIRGTNKAVAMSVDCNSRYCYLDPYVGGMLTLCEAARNVACSGARPLAITDCLNFGNPEKPEVMWQFSEAVRGIAEACDKLNTPVVSGNVSLYNETKGNAIYPTPTVVMVGVLDGWDKVLTQDFKQAGDVILLIGDTFNDLGGSEYLYVCHDIEQGMPPAVILEKEAALIELLIELNEGGLIKSAHDCSEGGLMVTLMESALSGNVGVQCELSSVWYPSLRVDSLLFGESPTRVVISVDGAMMALVKDRAQGKGLNAYMVGHVIDNGADNMFNICLNNKQLVQLPMVTIKNVYDEALGRALERT